MCSTPGFPPAPFKQTTSFLASGVTVACLRLVEGVWAGLPWMDRHKRDLHFNGCRAPKGYTKHAENQPFPVATYSRRRCSFPYHVHVSSCEEDWTYQRSIFAEEGNQYKVSLSRWSGVLLAVQTVQLSLSLSLFLWYVEHFSCKRVNTTTPATEQASRKWAFFRFSYYLCDFTDSGQVQNSNWKRRWRRFFSSTVITPSSVSQKDENRIRPEPCALQRVCPLNC